MKPTLAVVMLAVFSLAPAPATPPAVRFGYVDVFVDSGSKALAAYQFELKAARADVAIVGVESGEHAAFRAAPYYDPAALQNERIVIAAFSTAKELPAGRTRVARVHLRIAGPRRPDYTIQLHTAASADGTRIPATIALKQGDSK